MSEPAEQPAGVTGKKKTWLPPRANRIARGGCVFLFIAFGFLVLGIPGPEILLGGLFLFALGWIHFLLRVFPEITWNLSMIASSLAVLAVAIGGLHAIARHFRKDWRVRGTLACTGVIGVLFAAAIAVSGVFHQAVWLAKGDILGRRGPDSGSYENLGKAHQLMAGLTAYEVDHERFPDSIYELYPDYLNVDPLSDSDFWLFKAKDQSLHEWLYYPEAKNLAKSPPAKWSETMKDDERLCLVSPMFGDRKIVVGKIGGSARIMRRDAFLELFSAQQAELLREDGNEQQ